MTSVCSTTTAALALILVLAGCGGRPQHAGPDAGADLRGPSKATPDAGTDLRGPGEATPDAGADGQPESGNAIDGEDDRAQEERPRFLMYVGEFFSIFPRPNGTHETTSILDTALTTGYVSAPHCPDAEPSSQEMAVFVERATRRDVVAAFADTTPCPTPSGNHVVVTLTYGDGAAVKRGADCAPAIAELVQAAAALIKAACARVDAGAP